MEYVEIPEGSSSAAPVIKPGPRSAKNCRAGEGFPVSLAGTCLVASIRTDLVQLCLQLYNCHVESLLFARRRGTAMLPMCFRPALPAPRKRGEWRSARRFGVTVDLPRSLSGDERERSS